MTATKIFSWGFGTHHYCCCRTKTEAARLAGYERARQLDNLNESNINCIGGRLAAERPGRVITTEPNGGRAIDGETVYENKTIVGRIEYGPEVREPYWHQPQVFVPAEPTPDPVAPDPVAPDPVAPDPVAPEPRTVLTTLKGQPAWFAALDALAGGSRSDYLAELVARDGAARGLVVPPRIAPNRHDGYANRRAGKPCPQS